MTLRIDHKTNWREAATAEYVERRGALSRKRERAEKTLASLQRKVAALEAEIAELDRGAKVFGLSVPEADGRPLFTVYPDTPAPPPAVQSGQFKDLALAYLADAYPTAKKALDVQKFVEATLGRSFHWKTAGMTLYRLKNEYKVRREGHQYWAFVPEDQREALRLQEEADRPRVQRIAANLYPDGGRDAEHWNLKARELAEDPGEQGPDDESEWI